MIKVTGTFHLSIKIIHCVVTCLYNFPSVCLSVCIRVSVCLSVCLHVCSAGRASVHASVSVHLPVHLTVCQSVRLCICVHPSVRASVSTSVCLSVHPCVCECIRPFICLSVYIYSIVTVVDAVLHFRLLKYLNVVMIKRFTYDHPLKLTLHRYAMLFATNNYTSR